jgi:hypothetical protein
MDLVHSNYGEDEEIDLDNSDHLDASVSNSSDDIETKDENDPLHFDKLSLDFVFASIARKPFSGPSSSFIPTHKLSDLVFGMFENLSANKENVNVTSLNENLLNFLSLFSFVLAFLIEEEDKHEDFRMDIFSLFCNLKNDLNTFPYWRENIFMAKDNFEWPQCFSDYLKKFLERDLPTQFLKRRECDILICSKEDSVRKFYGEKILKIANKCLEEIELDQIERFYDESKSDPKVLHIFRRKLFVERNSLHSRNIKTSKQDMMLTEYDKDPEQHWYYHPCHVAFCALFAMKDEGMHRNWISDVSYWSKECKQKEKDLVDIKDAASKRLVPITKKSVTVRKQSVSSSSRKKVKLDARFDRSQDNTSQLPIAALDKILEAAKERITFLQDWKIQEPVNTEIRRQLEESRSVFNKFSKNKLDSLIEMASSNV